METRSERKRRLEENETAPDRPLEQVACSVDKDDMSSASARKKNELDPISPFENLPKEIIWMILEYVPEAVLKLREACSTVKSQVDDFARQRSSIALVEILAIFITQERTSEFNLLLNKNTNKLFALRHKLLGSEPHSFKIRKDCFDNYSFIWKPTATEIVMDKHSISFLKGFIGKRITDLVDTRCSSTEDSQNIADILNGVQFRRLHVFVQTLTEEMVKHFLEPIIEQKVDQLVLLVDRKVMVLNPIALLQQLSKRVRFLTINQPAIPGIETSRNYLFGVHNADWGQIIPEMFSGKLDKLEISTVYQRYLHQSSADLLLGRLPTHSKKIWFETTYNGPIIQRAWKNDHFIEAALGYFDEKLVIKHISREREQYYDNFIETL